ncbi:hypothetical protein [Pedobacter sp.]|jgi:hypothetical protein|uniref:hypothetical protein n=1 Tax=Pedobacter sp. TaxID=1411316 RepID=UPI002BB3F078|nr:hypothetical protein [Pedobacter sp.]HWW39660.1 hypothetical protein [Pedobacter sp.]
MKQDTDSYLGTKYTVWNDQDYPNDWYFTIHTNSGDIDSDDSFNTMQDAKDYAEGYIEIQLDRAIGRY